MKSFLALLVVALVAPFGPACQAAGGEDDAKATSPRFKITTRRVDDIVEIRGDSDRAVVDVQSPFGISQAAVERLEDHWPKAVVVKLHLKALEIFEVANGKVSVRGSAGIRDGKVEVRLWKDNQEDKVVGSADPLWIEFRVLAGDDKPATSIPLKDGYFELTLPKAFFGANPKVITLKWIDFYRG